jgi:hypothetical protein
VVSRRALGSLFSAALALACVVAAPSALRTPGAPWIGADHSVAAQPGRAEARVGRTGEGRLVPGLAASLLALLPVATILPPPAGRAGTILDTDRSTVTRGVRSAWSARGPPA